MTPLPQCAKIRAACGNAGTGARSRVSPDDPFTTSDRFAKAIKSGADNTELLCALIKRHLDGIVTAVVDPVNSARVDSIKRRPEARMLSARVQLQNPVQKSH